MIDRGLVVFSGLHPKVAGRTAPQLAVMAIDSAFVALNESDIDEYFERLIRRSLFLARRILERPDVRLSALLISCLDGQDAKAIETAAFFPALRRLALPGAFANDQNAAPKIAARVRDTLRGDDHKAFARAVTPNQEARLLLPLKNSGQKSMATHFESIYHGESSGLTPKLSRLLAARRGERSYRIGSLDFKPASNDGTHPIRRCTDTARCDLQALLRFGMSVPSRFEFDVSCENGLKGKSFFLCDGSRNKIKRDVSHLNMRINDDYREG